MKARLAAWCLGLLVAAGHGPVWSQMLSGTPGDASGPCERVDSYATVLVSGDPADVYHPVPARGGTPVVAFLQGGLTDKSLYSGFARELACAGYVVVVPNRFAALIPGQPPQIFTSQQVINHVLATMQLAQANPASPVYGAVDASRLAVAGHSFGGAAALFAVEGSCRPPFCFGFFARPPQLKAVAVFGVNTFLQGAPLDVNSSAVPVAMIQGSLDGRATPARAQATYALLEAPKAFITIEGLNHWGIIDVQNPAGNTPDPNQQTQPQAWGIAKTAKFTRLMFDAYLKGDRGALRQLRGDRGEPDVTVQLAE